MNKVITEGFGAFSQHYPRVAAVVTAQARGKANAMAVAWHLFISTNPPLYGISISPKRFTYELIVDSKEFGVNFLPLEMAELVAAVGGISGREMDKFQRFNIALDEPVKTTAPILTDAYAAYECKLVDDKLYGDHRLLVGEIVAVHWLEDAFTPEEVLNSDNTNPALYLGQDFYLTTAKNTIRHIDRAVYGRR